MVERKSLRVDCICYVENENHKTASQTVQWTLYFSKQKNCFHPQNRFCVFEKNFFPQFVFNFFSKK